MNILKKFSLYLVVALAAYVLVSVSSSVADGCPPGSPCYNALEKPKAATPPPPTEVIEEEPEEVAEPETAEVSEPVAAIEAAESEWKIAVSPGLTVLFFDCEDTEVAPALYLDVRHTDLPLNLRFGIEGTQINSAEQYVFQANSRFRDKPDFDFIRLPLSLEFILPLIEDSTDILLGAGPDLIIVEGDGSDTDLGWHVGARVEQMITEQLSASVGGGYLWAEPKVRGENLDLDSAFVGVNISYVF